MAYAFTNRLMAIICHDYEPALCTLRLPFLYNKRFQMDSASLHKILYKIINGIYDCSDILELFKFHIPGRILRGGNVFHVELHCIDYGKYGPVNRIYMLANEHSEGLEMFASSFKSFNHTVSVCLR